MGPVTIGALSKRTGCNVETIRYYERIGLLPAPPRSPGGHRLYDEDHVKRLTFVRRGRELGFSLKELRSLLGLVDSGHYTCAEVKAMTLDHLAGVCRRIGDLKRLEKVLRGTAESCEGGASTDCPILDALYDRRSAG